MFPKGKLVESRREEAVKDTKKLLDDREGQIFQATFEEDGMYAMVDVLEYDETQQHWIINEVKGTSSNEVKNLVHIQDIELNKEFRKDRKINPKKLLKISDITETVKGLEDEINEQILDRKRLMEKTAEPAPCDCLYKSRVNHCPAFAYLYPDVPDYSVHDIVRIGSSLKSLEGLVEAGNISFNDVPAEFKLSKYQRNYVDVEQGKISIIDPVEIKQQFSGLQYPIYFLDYETYPTAVPVYDGCAPYQQVPFQYSLHVLSAPGAELTHHEYIHTDENSHPMRALADSLTKVIGDSGSIIVWNKKFESKCNEDIAELIPEYAEIFHGCNKRIYDLMNIFSKHHYYHHDFRGSFSIKAVLPVLVPELTYKNLNIQDGGMVMNGWKKMMFDMEDAGEKEVMTEDLLRYCELDTLAMVKIFEVVGKL